MSEEQCIKLEKERVAHKPGRIKVVDKRWGGRLDSRRASRATSSGRSTPHVKRPQQQRGRSTKVFCWNSEV